MIGELVAAELVTSRLLIRRLTPGDAQSYFDIFSNTDVMRYWSSAPLTTIAQAEKKITEILDHYRKRDLFQFALERKRDGKIVGTCTLHHIHEIGRAHV